MTPRVLMRRIIAPQAIRVMVPALGNETVSTPMARRRSAHDAS